MNYKILLVLLCLLGCHSTNNVRDLIQGDWYFKNNSNLYIEITKDEYTVKNDSPYSEDYKIIGDTLLLKGFEAEFRGSANEPGYTDTLKILKITKDTLILKEKVDILILHKK
jgi:hypothetical protein